MKAPTMPTMLLTVERLAAGAKTRRQRSTTNRVFCVMEGSGVRTGQVRAVRGFADTQLHVENAPMDPRNRRVSIVVRSHASTNLDQAVRAGADAPGAEKPQTSEEAAKRTKK